MRRTGGFTIVEVVASVFILGLAVVAAASMFALGNSTSSAVEEDLTAYTLLEKKMEELAAADFDSVRDEGRNAVTGYPDYETEVAVSLYGGDSDLKQVDVTIYWTGVYGTEESQTVTTLVNNFDRY